MSLIKYRPVSPEINPLWMENWTPVSRLIDEFFNRGREVEARIWGPNVDIVENETHYEILAELPGVKLDDVKLTLNNNLLTISGEKKQEIKEEKENTLRVERTYGRFERSFNLPRTVKADQVRASFEDGVLRVALPKAEESRTRTINIEVKK